MPMTMLDLTGTDWAAHPSMAPAADDFAEIVRRHAPALRRYALRLGAGDDCDDVVQEALIKAWRAFHTFDARRAALSTWLHRIVHNQCIDTLRRRPPLAEPEEAGFDAASEDGGGIAAERAAVRRAVAALPERQRAALILRQMQGFSQREAAEILGVSEDALESLQARAKRTLRKRLASLLEDNPV